MGLQGPSGSWPHHPTPCARTITPFICEETTAWVEAVIQSLKVQDTWSERLCVADSELESV